MMKLSPVTEDQLRQAVTRFIESARGVTGDRLAAVQAADEPDTDDGCRRMCVTVQWSDTLGKSHEVVGQFLTEPSFCLDRFHRELDAFMARIQRRAGVLH